MAQGKNQNGGPTLLAHGLIMADIAPVHERLPEPSGGYCLNNLSVSLPGEPYAQL